MEEKLHPETISISAGRPESTPDSSLNPPIELTSTFTANGPRGYGRYGNQTWSALENAISELEGGKTLTYSSGMAAITAAFSLLPFGARVVASNQGYSGTMGLLREKDASGALKVHFVEITDTPSVIAAFDGADFFWGESPTNPCLDVAELQVLITEAKKRGLLIAVDNTFATALNQKPLSMGSDISMNSVTKYLAGHSDVLMGSLSTQSPELLAKLETARRFIGSIPGPFEAWLALRGIRTFPLRFERAGANARELAERLTSHPKVSRVRYPGFGAVVSFEITGSPEAAEKVCNSSQLITHATSLGGIESLWERRRRWPIESTSVPENLIRLSVGCEHVDDLWRDIELALKNG